LSQINWKAINASPTYTENLEIALELLFKQEVGWSWVKVITKSIRRKVNKVKSFLGVFGIGQANIK